MDEASQTPALPADSAGNGPGVDDPGKPGAKPAEKPARPKRRRLRRVLLGIVALIPVLLIGLWIGIHRVEWLGPWLADTGRSIVGNDAIAKLEDFAYGVEDRFNRATRADEKPTAHWEVPPTPTSLTEPEDPARPHAYPRFQPENVPPMYPTFAAPGDGTWVPLVDPHAPDEPPPIWKTLLHPDKKRGWAAVALIAVDLRQVRLHLVAGMYEPMSKLKEAREHTRTGLIAPADLKIALAAFNGGFKATHGNYGMKAEGVLFIEPRVLACTVATYPGDVIRIKSWEAIGPSRDQMVWFRQAPGCMYEDGAMHKGLTVEENTMWGATLDKDTVIRRSAIGISQDGRTLFAAISEATNATAIAKAVHHAGAHDVAQLDVNFSYPKLVTVEARDGSLDDPKVKAIIDGFEYSEDDYVKKPMSRDFFYLTRKSREEVAGRSAP